MIQYFGVQVFLVPEIVVDVCLGESGAVGNCLNAGRLITEAAEFLYCRLQNGVELAVSDAWGGLCSHSIASLGGIFMSW